MKTRKYTRLEQRRYKEERRQQAERVAGRLMGKRKTPEPFFGGNKIQTPVFFDTYMLLSYPRSNFIITGL